MDPREELAALRRLAELEAKAGGGSAVQTTKQKADKYAGEDVGSMGSVMRGLGGAKAAWDRAALGLKGLVTDLTPEDKALLEQGKAFTQEGGTAATVGSIGADVAMSAAPASRVMQAANLVKSAPVLARTLATMGFGTGYGALTNPEDRAQGAKEGAIGTAIGMGASRALGGLLKPVMTDDAAALVQRGIVPTPGQAVGGVTNTVEQKLQSVPFMGDLIRRGRERAVNEFNEKAIQTAVPGAKGFGDEALTGAREAIGNQYKAALSGLKNIQVDAAKVATTAATAVDDASLALSDASKKRVMDYVQKNLVDRSQNIDGETAKRIESDLAKVVARYKGGTSTGEEKAMGEALDQVLDQWRTSLSAAAQSASKGGGNALREADQAWRTFIPLDKAASSAGAQGAETAGRFTPKMLRRAIEASDKSQFNNATRSMRNGGTPFDDLNQLTRQGESVLSNTVPDSGTAGRAATALTAAGAGAGLAGGYAVPLAAGTAGAAAAYSRPGSQFLLQGLEPAYKTLMLRGYVPAQLDRIIKEYGPEALIAAARGQQLAPN